MRPPSWTWVAGVARLRPRVDGRPTGWEPQGPARDARRAGGRAFTLLEVLVVIAALSLLAGLLFPVLASARGRARRTVCLSHLRQLAHAHQLYLQEWDERFPSWSFAAPQRPAPYGRYRFWTEYLSPFVRGSAIFRDPTPSTLGPEEMPLSDYALLTWERHGWAVGSQDYPYYRWLGPSLTQAEVRRPAETITLADGYTSGRPEIAVERRRHDGGLHVGFLDGHARWMSAEQIAWVATDGNGFYWLHYGTADR